MAAKDLLEFMEPHDPAFSDLWLALKTSELRQQYGHWEEHPDYPIEDWCYEVNDGDTRFGYWEWVTNGITINETSQEESDRPGCASDPTQGETER